MSVASVTQGLSQNLSSSLDFSLPGTADYILQRNNVSFLPQSGDSWAPSQQRHVQFRMSGGSGFVDPATVVITADLHVTGTDPIQPTCAFHGLWSKFSIHVGGTPIENLEDFASTSEIVYRLMPPQAKIKYCDKSFPLNLTQTVTMASTGTPVAVSGTDVERGVLRYGQLQPGKHSVMMPFIASGLFSQGQKLFLPLQFMSSLVINMELGPANSWLQTGTGLNSGTYYLTNIRLLADEVILDPSLVSELASKLSSVPLNIPMNQFNSYVFANSTSIPAPTISISRALSKLRQIYIKFIENPAETANTQSTISEFYRPQGTAEPTVRLQIGSRLWPQKGPVGEDSQAEWLYRLELATGSFQSLYNCHGLSRAVYEGITERAFIQAIDLETLIHADPDLAFLGYNMRDQPTLVLNYKGLDGRTAADITTGGAAVAGKAPPQEIRVYLLSSSILSISLDSVSLLE